jgi:EAL domain-containing protein (putative c-di-GMP-specific phosphodiesterase class I)/CheY-like chemotaxis protein
VPTTSGSAHEAQQRAPLVLVVDDDASVRALFTATLQLAGLRAMSGEHGGRALELLDRHAVDLVLLDASMPVLDGRATLAQIRADGRTATVPVIFVTGSGDVADRIRGLDAGADDYLEKPLDPDELVARVRAHLRGREAFQRSLLQRLRSRSAVARALGRVPAGGDARDMAARICACLDELDPEASSAIVAFSGEEAEVLAATGAFACGRQAGSARLAQAVTARLHRQATTGGWVEQRAAQPAGAVGVPLAEQGAEAAAFVPLVVDDAPFGVVAMTDARAQRDGDASQCLSAGTDLAPLVSALLRTVLGRGGRDAGRQAALRRRIDDGAFYPVFQPVVELASARIVGFEALTRFADGTSPEPVFTEARALGLGIELEVATLRAALAGAAALPDDAWLSLNVSPGLLTSGPGIEPLLERSPRPIVLELTEHDPIDDYTAVLASMERLGGPRLSVDDAGAGYACLHHVLELRPAFVKLDRGWVSGIADDPARQALVAGLGDFAERTGGVLIAEGIEETDELEVLRDLRVPLGQGWLLGRPARVPARA